MKFKVVKFLLCVLCVLFTGVFCAYGVEKISKTGAVTVKTVHPPQSKTSGTVDSLSSTSRDLWVEAELSFNTNNIKEIKQRFIDSPELEVQLVSYYADGSRKPVVFTGKIAYWTLENDGRTHYMKALLPAALVRRYTGEDSASKVVWLARMALTSNGRNLCIAYGSSKSVPDKIIYSYFRENLKNAFKLDGAVSGRYGTPWSIIGVNKYELEKIK